MSTQSARRQGFQKNWLLVTAFLIASFGPVLTAATRTGSSGLARWSLEVLNGPGGGAESFAAGTTQFLSALTGGFLFGWGLMIFCLRQWAFDAAPEGVRRAVVAGLVGWFVLDSFGSVLSGHAWNVVFNVPVLLLGVGPMWLPAVEAMPESSPAISVA